MDAAEAITVEVACALPRQQVLLEIQVPRGTTAREAVQRSGIGAAFPELDVEQADLGVFGKVVKPDQELRPGDRVEVYRPLIADPKEARRLRAAEGKKAKRA